MPVQKIQESSFTANSVRASNAYFHFRNFLYQIPSKRRGRQLLFPVTLNAFWGSSKPLSPGIVGDLRTFSSILFQYFKTKLVLWQTFGSLGALLACNRKSQTLSATFFSQWKSTFQKVDETGCWLWLKSVKKQMKFRNKRILLNRYLLVTSLLF